MAITADISLMRSDVSRAGGAMRDNEAERGRGERACSECACVCGNRGYDGVVVGVRERYSSRHQEEIALLPPALRW